MISSKLINSRVKPASKNVLEDIGVFEDTSGAEVSATNDTEYELQPRFNLSHNSVFDHHDDDNDDDDDDDEDDDEDDEDCDDHEVVDGTGAINCSKKNVKNIFGIDIKELIKTATSASEKKKKPEKEFEDIDFNLETKSAEDARKSASINKILEKSVIKPGFEKLHAIPYETSEKRLRLERKKQRERTKGAKWFNMPAPEMTEEVKNDLMILQMRSALDPKHFYKKNDLSVLPKYFQVGKVVDSPEDFYSSRIPKKARKKTIVDELLADAEFKKYNKRRYLEITEQKKRTHYKAHKQAKKLKRKGKKK